MDRKDEIVIKYSTKDIVHLIKDDLVSKGYLPLSIGFLTKLDHLEIDGDKVDFDMILLGAELGCKKLEEE